MRADVLRDLMARIDGCEAGQDAKDEFRRLVVNAALKSGVDLTGPPKQRDERVQFARHLLRDQRETRSVIRERLIARFGVSRSQAYADIEAAL